MENENLPWSEVFRNAADKWVDCEAAAQLLEDTKSAVMAQKQAALGDMPVNRAEQQVKASPEWMEYVESVVVARKEANAAKMQLEFIRMKFQEQNNADANHRAEMRL